MKCLPVAGDSFSVEVVLREDEQDTQPNHNKVDLAKIRYDGFWTVGLLCIPKECEGGCKGCEGRCKGGCEEECEAV